MTDYDPHTLRTYLLGQAPEEVQDELERQILAGGDTYAAVLEAETDLIDDYARGHLDPAECSIFEEHVLPRFGVATRLQAARRIHTWVKSGESEAAATEADGAGVKARRKEARPVATVDSGADRRRGAWQDGWLGGLLASPALRPALAAALVLLVGALGLLTWQTMELSRQVADLSAAHDSLSQEREALSQREAELAAELAAARATLADADAGSEDLADARQRIQELEGELADSELRGRRRLPGPRRTGVDVTYLLTLATRGAAAGDAVPAVEVPEGEGRVLLQLDAGGEGDYYDAFQARLLGPGGDELWSRTGLAADPDTGTVDLALPAQAIDPGRHEVLLEGLSDGEFELVGAYEMDVRRP